MSEASQRFFYRIQSASSLAAGEARGVARLALECGLRHSLIYEWRKAYRAHGVAGSIAW